ncbi:MAG: transposase [Methylocystaceae bacterium]|nr:transposase [Methylocystaceae bacterium]
MYRWVYELWRVGRVRIQSSSDQSERFIEDRIHINGIEKFWNQAKRHMRRFNGMPREHFHLCLRECEWRFNNSDPRPKILLLK